MSTLIIQPLVSVMRNQRDKVIALGFNAINISDVKERGMQDTLQNVIVKKYKYIILLPEIATPDSF